MTKNIFIFFLFSLFSVFGQTSDRFTIKNIGVNTTSNEFGTVVSKIGGIYYLKSNFKGEMDLDESSASLYRGEIGDRGEITKGLKFPTDAIHAVFTKDGQYVYFSKKVGNKFQLFKAYVDNTGRWKNEIRLPFNDLNFNFKQPALSLDNTKLFFISDRSDTYGSTDIYYVDIKNKGLEYSQPIHLGFYVNSPQTEIFPYLGENDKIYFSSNGMGGEGGFDVFESFLSNGQYEKTANLGIPINSAFDDFAYTLITGNTRGYFSSNRQGGKGGIDIYYFEDKKPTLNNCSRSISGFVKNKENQKPIFEAIVEVFDSNGNNENTLTDQNGQFVIENVECEATYDLVAYKEGFNGFAEAHTDPKTTEVINLYLNPEFPEGFKEEFDLTNEMVAIDTKTNEIIIPEKNNPIIKNKDNENVKEETKTIAAIEPKTEKKAVEEYYDPLDYDPYSQTKKTTPKSTIKEEAKKEITEKKDWDPLDYDPYSETPKQKEVLINKNKVETNINPAKKEEVVDYDPLDYDPRTQSKNAPIQKAQQINQIEEAKKKKELALVEREKIMEEARLTSEKLKIDEQAKNAAVAQQESQKKKELEQQKQAQIQAVADAKKRDEQSRRENEAIAKTKTDKERQAEAERIQTELNEKARIEQERQDKLLAQQKSLEEERQKRIAQAKATADQLKKEEEAKNNEIAQREAQQKVALEQQKQAQIQAVADAKKRDEQSRRENEAIAKTKTDKERQAEAERIQTELNEKARIEQERQDKLLAQQKSLEEERQKRIAQAKATADQLKKEEEAKNNEIAQREAQQKETVKANIDKPLDENNEIIKFHTVQKGEGLYSIAKNNNLTVDEVKALNNLKDNNVKIGQKLIVSKTEPFKQNKGSEIVSTDILKEKQLKDLEKNEVKKNNTTDELDLKQARANQANETYLRLKKEKEIVLAQNKAPKSNEEPEKIEKNETVCAKNITGSVLNSKTKKGLNNVIIDMYFEGQNIESTHTDLKGNFYFNNVDCDTKFTLICYRENYDNIAKAVVDTKYDPKNILILLDPNEPQVEANNNPIIKETTQNQVAANKKTPAIESKNTSIEKDEMTYTVEPEKLEAPKVEAGKVILNPIYFDLDEWYLTSEARRELDKIILLMKMNPTMIIESGSHTDTRGPFEYNLELSERRSQETVGYLIANGVDPDRISGRGYGETMPVNHCLDGVKCSDAEHMENRRTEFVILKY